MNVAPELLGGVAALLVAIVAYIFRRGKLAGKQEAEINAADEAYEVEVKDAEMELSDKQSLTWPQRVDAARRRAAERRRVKEQLFGKDK